MCRRVGIQFATGLMLQRNWEWGLSQLWSWQWSQLWNRCWNRRSSRRGSGHGGRGLSRRGEWSCWNTRCPLKLAGISLSCWSARDARRLEVPTSWVYAAVQVKTAQVLFWTLGFHGWNSRFQPYSSAAAQCDSLWEYATIFTSHIGPRGQTVSKHQVLEKMPKNPPQNIHFQYLTVWSWDYPGRIAG